MALVSGLALEAAGPPGVLSQAAWGSLTLDHPALGIFNDYGAPCQALKPPCPCL